MITKQRYTFGISLKTHISIILLHHPSFGYPVSCLQILTACLVSSAGVSLPRESGFLDSVAANDSCTAQVMLCEYHR